MTLAVLSIFLLVSFDVEKVHALEAIYYNVVEPRNDVQILDGVSSSAFGTADTSKFIGEEITSTSSLVGQRISKVGIHMEKVTDGQTLLGTVYIGFWGNTAEPTLANALRIFGSIPANNIANSNTQYNFSLASGMNYTIPANSAVGAFYIDPLGSGSGSDGIFISAKNEAFNGLPTRATCNVNNSTLTQSCFDAVVCTMGCGTQWADSTMDVIMLMSAEVPDEEEEEISEFCQDPNNEDLLRCKLENQGGALGGDFTNNPFDISSSSSNILIQTGFLDGSDTNPATNGTGYLLLGIALLIVNVLLWVGTSGEAFRSNTLFLPALISLFIVMGFTVASLVEPTVLIISIVVVIALASPKIISIINRGDSS